MPVPRSGTGRPSPPGIPRPSRASTCSPTWTWAIASPPKRADEAVAAWSRALDLAEGMDSARTRSAFASIRHTFTLYRRRGVPGTGVLEQRIQHAPV